MSTQSELINSFADWSDNRLSVASNMRVFSDVEGTADRFLVGGGNGKACVLAKASPFDHIVVYDSQRRYRRYMTWGGFRNQIYRVRNGLFDLAGNSDHINVETDGTRYPEKLDELEPVWPHLHHRIAEDARERNEHGD